MVFILFGLRAVFYITASVFLLMIHIAMNILLFITEFYRGLKDEDKDV
jgi:hypothetical protein